MQADSQEKAFLPLDHLCPAVGIASCFQCEPPFWFSYPNPAHHLILVESGHLKMQTPDGVVHAGPGDLLYCRPTSEAAYGSDEKSLWYQTGIIFAAPPRHRHIPWLDGIGPLPSHVVLGDSFDAMRRVFETLCLELNRPGAASRLRLQSAVQEMLAIVADVCAADPAPRPRMDRWQRLYLRLATDLSADMSVADMAREMGIGIDHFIRQFKQRFGMTPHAYRTSLKVREAARLLRSGERSVKSVAYQLGFESTASFTRIFKRYSGTLPSHLAPGAAPPAVVTEETRGKLYPMNEHVLPAKAGPGWLRDWTADAKSDALT